MNCHSTDIGPCPDMRGRTYRWLVRTRPSKRYEDATVVSMCPAGEDVFSLVSRNDLALSRHQKPSKRGYAIKPVSRYHRAILENAKGKFVVVTPKLYAEIKKKPLARFAQVNLIAVRPGPVPESSGPGNPYSGEG